MRSPHLSMDQILLAFLSLATRDVREKADVNDFGWGGVASEAEFVAPKNDAPIPAEVTLRIQPNPRSDYHEFIDQDIRGDSAHPL